MSQISIREDAMEVLVAAAKLGVEYMRSRRAEVQEDKADRMHLESTIRRTESMLAEVESACHTSIIKSPPAKKAKTSLITDIGDHSEDKMNWIEGRR
jgi:hypothetical protein